MRPLDRRLGSSDRRVHASLHCPNRKILTADDGERFRPGLRRILRIDRSVTNTWSATSRGAPSAPRAPSSAARSAAGTTRSTARESLLLGNTGINSAHTRARNHPAESAPAYKSALIEKSLACCDAARPASNQRSSPWLAITSVNAPRTPYVLTLGVFDAPKAEVQQKCAAHRQVSPLFLDRGWHGHVYGRNDLPNTATSNPMSMKTKWPARPPSRVHVSLPWTTAVSPKKRTLA